MKGLLLNHGLDREFQRVQKGLLQGALVNDLDDGVVVHIRGECSDTLMSMAMVSRTDIPSGVVACSSRPVSVIVSVRIFRVHQAVL